MTDDAEPPSTTPETAPALVAAYKRAIESGDAGQASSALERIFRRYQPLVRHITRVYRLSDQDADDVSQTVWLRLVEKIDKIREPRALPGWISTTAKIESLQVLRTRRSSVGDPIDPASVSPANLGYDDAEVDEEGLLRAAQRSAVSDEFAKLNPEHVHLLQLLLADPPGSYEEISKILGMPTGSIGPTRARALARLKKTAAPADADDAAVDPVVDTTQKGPFLTVVSTVPSANQDSSTLRPTIVQIEAAKLRLVTDRRLGKVSPEWVKRVAQGLPPQSVKATG